MESGRFMASAVRTVEKSFGETRLLAPQETHKLQDRSVYVIAGRFSENVASPGPFSGSQSPEWWSSRSSTFVFPKRDVDNLLTRRARESPLLTDDYAPVDMLMTSHFVTYSKWRKMPGVRLENCLGLKQAYSFCLKSQISQRSGPRAALSAAENVVSIVRHRH
jgi:hypothetical protein